MTHDEILRAVERLYAGGDGDEEDLAVMLSLRAALPNSDISNLIFWDFRDLTPEQVVEEALRREAEQGSATANDLR